MVTALTATLGAAPNANAQTLQLTGISSYWANANGSFISAPWTTDHTPTPGNWFGIWVSNTPGGAFLAGVSQSDLGRVLTGGTNNMYAVLDAAIPHAGLEAYRGFNLFFNNEVVPRMSIVTPTSTFASYSAINASITTPRLRYDAGPFVNAAGTTSFTQDGFVYALSAFDQRQAPDRVYANLPQSDGYTDQEFHFGISVTTVAPEPATFVLLAVGMMGVFAVRARAGRRGSAF
jgi:hypothetical protein